MWLLYVVCHAVHNVWEWPVRKECVLSGPVAHPGRPWGRMSAAIQATAHPARSVATSQTPQLPQVLQMHTGIQTHVPKAGVGVQVQHPALGRPWRSACDSPTPCRPR